jgi:hypothetical protein
VRPLLKSISSGNHWPLFPSSRSRHCSALEVFGNIDGCIALDADASTSTPLYRAVWCWRLDLAAHIPPVEDAGDVNLRQRFAAIQTIGVSAGTVHRSAALGAQIDRADGERIVVKLTLNIGLDREFVNRSYLATLYLLQLKFTQADLIN